MSSRATQRGQILSVLIAARGDWVPLPKITECAAQYNARIFELRRSGFRIANQVRDVGGERHSWFRLESPPADVSPQESENLAVAIPHSFPQFGILAPERYGD